MNTIKLSATPVEKHAVRDTLMRLEGAMRKQPSAIVGSKACPLKHTFVDGAYIREITMPAGMLLTSKIHKKVHPYFVLKGDVSVLTEEGVVRIKAPFQGITPAGTKRLLYIHEETVWTTVHVTESKDLDEIEEEIIAKTFDDVLPEHKEALKLKEV